MSQSEAQQGVTPTGIPEVSTESTILTGEETGNVINDTPTVTDTSLPSEQSEVILGKFNTQEDLIKAYQELEKKLGGGQESPQEPVVPVVTEVPVNVVEEYSSKIMDAGGSVTPEIYAELAGKGYTKEFVDTYIQGVQSQEQAAFQDLVKDIGGEQAYSQAVQWAQATMNKEQLTAYNDALGTADQTTAKLIMESLINKSRVGQPQSTGPIHTNTPTTPTSVSGYDTKSDYIKDSSDPRYGKDPGYTQKVEQKMAITDTAAWYSHLSRGI